MRRIIQATQTPVFPVATAYAQYARVLERLCDDQVRVTIRTDRKDGEWDRYFGAAIPQRALGLSSPRLLSIDWLLDEEPYAGLAARAMTAAHLAAFQRSLAELDATEWKQAASSPSPARATAVSDGISIHLLLFVPAASLAATLNYHLQSLAADGPERQPAHRELAAFSRCLGVAARGRYPVTFRLDKKGLVHLDLKTRPFGEAPAFYCKAAPESLDILCDAVLLSHPWALDQFVAGLDPEVWQRAATEYRYRHWGIEYRKDTVRLSADGSRIWRVLGARLAEEASGHRTESKPRDQ